MIDVFLDPLMREAVVAGMLLSCTFALIGVFVVLRRIVFVGMTVAQVASAGTAFSFFLATAAASVPLVGSPWWHHWGDSLCSALFTLVAVVAIAGGSRSRSLPSEALNGFAFAAFWGAGILFVAHSGQGTAEVRNLIQGDLLLICTSHLLVVALVALVVWASLLVFWKENVMVSFDPDMAQALGFRVNRWNLAFYCLLGLAVVAGIRSAGLLLIFTYLVIPPVAGLTASRSVATAAFASVATALAATVFGLSASFRWDLPTSPTIVVSTAAVALAVMAFGRRSATHRA